MWREASLLSRPRQRRGLLLISQLLRLFGTAPFGSGKLEVSDHTFNYSTAIASISTSMPVGRAAAWIVVRAGGIPLKYCP